MNSQKVMCYSLRLGALLVILIGSGCAHVGPPRGEDLYVEAGRTRTVVLLRLIIDSPGETQAAFPAGYLAAPFWLGLGDFYSAGMLKAAPLRFFSKETRLDGWTYLLLEPGVYYLGVLAPQEQFGNEEEAWKRIPPSWRLEVSSHGGTIYGGTLVAPRAERTTGFRLFGYFDRNRVAVRNESAEAREIHESWLKGIEPFITHLAASQSSSEPLILETPPGR